MTTNKGTTYKPFPYYYKRFVKPLDFNLIAASFMLMPKRAYFYLNYFLILQKGRHL